MTREQTANRTAALVVDAQAGESEAFATIVEMFQDMAVGFAFSRVRDFGMAEEIAQEAFLSAFLDLKTLRDAAAFPAWFKRIILARCNRATRRKCLPTIGLDSVVELPSPEPGRDDSVESEWVRSQVFTVLGDLSESEATVITLHYIGGYSYKEIGEFLEVPVSTVKSRLYEARRRLRDPLLKAMKEDLRGRRPSRDQSFTGTVDESVRSALLADPEGNVFAVVESTA